MTEQTFIKDQEFILSAPADYGIEPPPGKTHDDFLGWRGCDPATVPNCAAGDLEKTLSSYSKITYIDITKIPCYYPVWNMYGWKYAEGQTSADFYIYVTSGNPNKNRKITSFPNSTGPQYNKLESHGIKYNDSKSSTLTASLSSGQVITEGGKIAFEVCNPPGKTLSNLYINGQLFAGIDVDETYWLAHKNDLYRLLPDNLSSNFCKTSPLSATNSYWLFSFNMTSCHVLSDNYMHLSCDVDTIGGSVNLYDSLEESL